MRGRHVRGDSEQEHGGAAHTTGRDSDSTAIDRPNQNLRVRTVCASRRLCAEPGQTHLYINVCDDDTGVEFVYPTMSSSSLDETSLLSEARGGLSVPRDTLAGTSLRASTASIALYLTTNLLVNTFNTFWCALRLQLLLRSTRPRPWPVARSALAKGGGARAAALTAVARSGPSHHRG